MSVLATGVIGGGVLAAGSVVQNLLGGKRRVSVASMEDPTLYVVEFDATIQETHTGDAEPTDHPVEQGADMTDHVRRKPESLELKAIVSDNPIVILPALNARPSVPGTDPMARVKAAYDLLRGFKDAAELLNVSTTLRDYTSMVIVGMSVSRDKDTGNILDLTLRLREIQIAKSETVASVKLSTGKKGTQSGKPADAAQERQAASVLGRFLGGGPTF